MTLSNYPYISAASPNSFARLTLEKRLPLILDNVITSGLYEEKINEQLKQLKQNLPGLQIKSIKLEKEELVYWSNFFESYMHKTMIEIPFFFAEIYFYKYLLEITRYAKNRIDPFSLIKANELNTNTDFLEKLLESVSSIEQAIHVALAGNKADLSQLERTESDLHIIEDHTEELVNQIEECETIHLILDNAGLELFSDFLLITQILKRFPSKKVKLYPKKFPLLVSDATLEDTNKLLGFLKNSKSFELNEFGKYINAQLKSDSIEVIIDSFWNSPNHFTHLPEQIKGEIKTEDVVIAKGDANYRRFYEDRMIPPTFQGAAVISDNQFALRTLKSEIIAGFDASRADQLNQKDPQWLVSGKYAVVQKLK